jgi:osmotically inducible protein OsmC
MPTRTARTAWNGTLQEGSGQVELSSSKVGTYDVSFPKRAAEDAGGATSPEELIAAAHASCYAMAFSGDLGRNGTPPTSLNVSATVTFDKVEAGWKVVSSALTVRGVVPGIDAATFTSLAEVARDGCPISGMMKGNVALSVEATLEA